MRTYHLRFTPCDLSGYTFDWLTRYPKYIVAQEDENDIGEEFLHYHILIESDNAPDSIRDMAKKQLGIHSTGGKGKNNKYYALIQDWLDPGYICKHNNILHSKGYTEKTLMEFVVSGKEKYLNKQKTPATAGEKSSTTPKCPRIPYQQEIIAIAYVEWLKYKKQCATDDLEVHPHEVVDFVCKAMREKSRGINAYLLQDIVNAVLYDDPDFRERTLKRLKSKIQV